MPLNEEDKVLSLSTLLSLSEYSQNEIELITKINDLAAQADIILANEPPTVLDVLKNNMQDNNDATFIFAKILDQVNQENFSLRQQHQNQGHYDIEPLYERPQLDQMQDHDITKLMPKPSNTIEVLGPVNRFQNDTEVLTEGINGALKEEKKKHIVIPVGPGHWRGLYITKPTSNEPKYKVELFDPYGPAGARQLTDYAEKTLAQCGIDKSQIEFCYTGPRIQQTDGYACGDFTCAYSHKKMQEFDHNTQYNTNLIKILDSKGNANHALRNASKEEIKQIIRLEKGLKDHHPKIINEISTGKKEINSTEKQSTMHELINKQAIENMPVKTVVKTEPRLTKQEQQIFDAAEGAGAKEELPNPQQQVNQSLNVAQKENVSQQLNHDKVAREYSKKGFVAIDLDGTALVQKFDKNKWYGFKNNRSDLRKQLIIHMKMAQDKGYDIVIMTARPEFVEKIILEPGRGKLGTKPTQDIVDELKKEGIIVSEIIRALPKGLKEGLKGAPMAETLRRYQSNGAPDAKGILFDDQLKQIKDVKSKQNEMLIAYDINSPKDSIKFIEAIGAKKENSLDENNNKVTNNIQDKINKLSEKLKLIDGQNYQQEKRVLEKVLNDLTTRLKESYECEYAPEIDWVNKATQSIELLITKLSTQSPITHKDISQMSKEIFGHSNPNTFVPNTKCERTIRNCLLYIERLPILADIKKRCETYRVHLWNVVTNSDYQSEPIVKAKEKLEIVNDFLTKLDNKNPTIALEQFNKAFKQSESIIKTSRTGTKFINDIRSFLSKIPLLGQLFKTSGKKLLDAIEHKGTDYSNVKHYQKELSAHKDEETNAQSESTLHEQEQQQHRQVTKSMPVETVLETEPRLTKQEQQIFEATVSEQRPNTHKDICARYKQEIINLIKSRNTVFDDAEKNASKKEEDLTDKELAARLQAQEFSNAGFRRS